MFEPITIWLKLKEKQLLGGDSNSARFARGTFWLTSSTVASLILGMIASIAVARMLNKTDFGKLGMVVNTIAMLGTFAGLGLGLTSTKYVAEFRLIDPARASRVINLVNTLAAYSGGAVSLLLFIFAKELSTHVLNAPELANVLRMGTVLLFFNTLNGTQSGALSGLEAFRTLTKVNVIRGAINFPIMITATYLFGLSGAVAGTVISGSAGWLLNHLALIKERSISNLPANGGKAFDEFGILWKFSLPALIGGALAGPVLWIANTILANQPGGYGELGLVNAANQWRNLITMLPSIFCSAALPILSSEQNSASDNRETLDLTQKVTISIIIPVYTVTIFLGDFIMGLYGKSFSGGYSVLVGITFAICLMAIANVGGTNLAASGKMWTGFFYNLVWGLVLVGFVYKYAAVGGAKAYALGYVVAYAVLFALMLWYLKNIFKRRTLALMLSSIAYLGLLTLICLELSVNNRFVLAVPFIILSIIVSFLILGRNYSLRIFDKINVIFSKKM